MEERIDSAAIIVRTVVSTLTALIVAIGLILGAAVAVSPRFAYGFYTSMGNGRGIYASADKLASKADRAYANLDRDAKVAYNVETRLPAFRLAADCGAEYYGGSAPKRVTARLYAVVTDADFHLYAQATDAANMARSTPGAHVYVTNEASYLCGEYVRRIYDSSAKDAVDFSAARFQTWLDALKQGVGDEILNDGGIVALLERVYGDPSRPDTQPLYTLFDTVCGDSALIEAVKEETTNILPALHIAKTCQLLYQLFGLLDSNRVTESAMKAWATAYDTLLARYVND